MMVSSDFLHKHRRENFTHFPITHTDDRLKDFIPFALAGELLWYCYGKTLRAALRCWASSPRSRRQWEVLLSQFTLHSSLQGLEVEDERARCTQFARAFTSRVFACNTNMLLLSIARLEVNIRWGVKYWDSCWIDVEDEFTCSRQEGLFHEKVEKGPGSG